MSCLDRFITLTFVLVFVICDDEWLVSAQLVTRFCYTNFNITTLSLDTALPS